jgi:hypothetical protein
MRKGIRKNWEDFKGKLKGRHELECTLPGT